MKIWCWVLSMRMSKPSRSFVISSRTSVTSSASTIRSRIAFWKDREQLVCVEVWEPAKACTLQTISSNTGYVEHTHLPYLRLKLVVDKVDGDVDLHSIAVSIKFQHTIMIATKNRVYYTIGGWKAAAQLRNWWINEVDGNEQRATQWIIIVCFISIFRSFFSLLFSKIASAPLMQHALPFFRILCAPSCLATARRT